MPFSVPALLAMLWYIVYVCLFMVLPELIVYCVWRFLRDLRRIAVALETIGRVPTPAQSTEPIPRPLLGHFRRESIVPSSLGRY